MKEIAVLIDISGSMTVLGKKEICKDLNKYLRLYPQINSTEELCFSPKDWDGTSESLAKLTQGTSEFLILTDGYACNDNCETILLELKKDISKTFAIILVGADSFFRQINHLDGIPVYRAEDIQNAVSFISGG